MANEASTSRPKLCGTSWNSSETEGNKRARQAERESLLPRLPDDLTISLILPRLTWRSMLKLTQVNRAWQATVRSPEIHELRAQACTAQTIVTIHQYECIISLYDVATETWHHLPRPPFGNMLIARGCGCVTLHGKLYILGGNGEDFNPRNTVHVFDIASKGRWQQCASMRKARKHFSCTVYEGKIYVFGGIGAGRAAEVYDPERDEWRDIAPMRTDRIEHKSVTVGDVLCVHMGRFLLPGPKQWPKWGYAHHAEIFDPRKNQWILVQDFTIQNYPKLMGPSVAEAAVVIDGKLFGILDNWLYVYEEPSKVGKDPKALEWDGTGKWRAVQAISWDVFRPPKASPCFNPFSRVALAIPNCGELLALVFGQSGSRNNSKRWTFLKSEGLGSADRDLKWKKIDSTQGATSWAPDAHDFPFSPCIESLPGAW